MLRVVLALSIVLLLAVLIWAFGKSPSEVPDVPGGDGEAAASETETPVADVVSDAMERAGVDSKDEPDESVETTEAKATFTISGTVVESVSGALRPVSGATVALGSRVSFGSRELRPIAEVVADSSGHFRIENANVVRRGELMLEAWTNDYVATEWLAVWAEPDEQIDEVQLFVEPGGVLRGRVVDVDGVPVAGAQVSAERTGAWRTRRAGSHPRTAYVPKPRARTTSADGGAFQFERLAVAGPWAAKARESKRRGRVDVGRLDESVGPIEIVLKDDPSSKTRIYGFVFGPDGRGVADANVIAQHTGQTNAKTDALGAFEITFNSSPWKCFLMASAEGHSIAMEEIERPEPETGPIVLRIEPEQRIAGALVDADGNPVPGAVVRIDGEPELTTNSVPPPTTLSMVAKKRVLTDEKGRFEFGRLTAGDYLLSFRGPSIGQFAFARAAAGDSDVRLVVGSAQGPHYEWSVSVRDALSGDPIEGANIGVSRALRMQYGSGGMGVASAVTDSQGVARVIAGALRESGEYMIDVGAAGYARGSVEKREYAPGAYESDVRLLPERGLRVRVIDANGVPVAQASVSIMDGEKSISIRTGRGGYRTPVSTDPTGVAILRGLPAKVLSIKAWVGKRVVEQPIDLIADIEHAADVTLPN